MDLSFAVKAQEAVSIKLAVSWAFFRPSGVLILFGSFSASAADESAKDVSSGCLFHSLRFCFPPCYECLLLFDVFLHREEEKHNNQNAVGNDFKTEEEERRNRRVGKAPAVIKQVEKGHSQPIDHGQNRAVYAHGDAVHTKTVFCLQMIQYVGKERHHDVCPRNGGESFERLADQHHRKVGGIAQTDDAAQNRNHTPDDDEIPFPDPVGYRPGKEHAGGQRNAGEKRQNRLYRLRSHYPAKKMDFCEKVIAENVEHIAAFEHRARLIEHVEDHNDPPVSVGNSGFQLLPGGDDFALQFSGIFGNIFLRDALAGEKVLQRTSDESCHSPITSCQRFCTT